MSDLFQTVRNFFAPKPNSRIIEAVNECGEKIYIEMESENTLETLLTKCKRLLSFVEKTGDVALFEKLSLFVVKVRQAKYRGDLFHEFDDLVRNLSGWT
jgi:hypothetical protein